MQIVVLAGGLAAMATEQGPESLWVVGGRPLVDWQLDRFVASGARSVVMCVGHSGDQVEAHVRRGLDRGLMVGYSYAGEQWLGTGGALRRAFARLEGELVVTPCDRYLPFDYAAPLADLRQHPEAEATMTVRLAGGSRKGQVAVEGGHVTAYDPRGQSAGLDHVEYGAVALRRSLLSDIADGAVWELSALWSKLARTGKLRAVGALEPYYEVGSPAARRELEQHLGSKGAP
jgi:N-acetyl-alpha-D-muramate 1-phosphate uridylyltransferase